MDCVYCTAVMSGPKHWLIPTSLLEKSSHTKHAASKGFREGFDDNIRELATSITENELIVTRDRVWLDSDNSDISPLLFDVNVPYSGKTPNVTACEEIHICDTYTRARGCTMQTKRPPADDLS
ncbi:hypothetical protein LSH36_680g00018 [Paralvinella palmiformis]|uniref:Uncharacterized protein n=1 Tax=Paralvinella palmiformis TaxID=53620 RepID=A0AAD9J3H9_9ANNE|nr:hypothetical protein LSH36_680g00018 [Paralvinella palmiformis]